MDPENSRIDQEKAIQGLARGRELEDELSRLVQVTSSCDDQSELAGGHRGGVKKAFDEVGISLVKPIDVTVPTEFHSPTSVLQQQTDGNVRSGVRSLESGNENPRDQRKSRRFSHLKRTITPSPFADGYQWRKYGQKVIRNVKYPRSYYKCTHTGCVAKLLIQQTVDSGSLPMYEVIRNNEHTCNAINPLSLLQHSSTSATPRGSSIITFESDRSTPNHFFSSSMLRLSAPARSHQPSLKTELDVVRKNSDSFSPPLSPVGQFYGPDASAYQ